MIKPMNAKITTVVVCSAALLYMMASVLITLGSTLVIGYALSRLLPAGVVQRLSDWATTSLKMITPDTGNRQLARSSN